MGGGEPVGEPALGIWAVSARTPAALGAQADRLYRHLLDHPGLDVTDLAYSLAATRTQHPYRAAITASAHTSDPRDELLTALRALHLDQPHPGLTRHHYRPHLAGKTVFVFPGQGAQYPGMGSNSTITTAASRPPWMKYAQPLIPTSGSLREVMFAEATAPVSPPRRCKQTVVRLRRGHAHCWPRPGSSRTTARSYLGELTAAYLAGWFSLADAAVLVSAEGPADASLSFRGDDRYRGQRGDDV